MDTKSTWQWRDRIWCRSLNHPNEYWESLCNPLAERPEIEVRVIQSTNYLPENNYICEVRDATSHSGIDDFVSDTLFWRFGKLNIGKYSDTPNTDYVIKTTSLDIAKRKAPAIVARSLLRLQMDHFEKYQRLFNELFE